MKKILTLCALLIISMQAYPASSDDDYSSQSSAAAEDTSIHDVRWYQVELLIFKQKPLSGDNAEIWPKDITLSYPDNWDTLKTPDQYQALYQKRVAPNTPFILLDKKQFQLAGIEKKLQINRNDILFHGAWRQSLTQNLDQNGATQTTPILIRGGASFDNHYELEGSVTLKLLRYLHIDTNLWLTHFVPASNTLPESAAVTNTTSSPTETTAAITWPELPTYPLATKAAVTDTTAANTTADTVNKFQVDEIVLNKQTRRMRSYETHYIDHPKFGILVRFIPLDENTMLPIPPKN